MIAFTFIVIGLLGFVVGILSKFRIIFPAEFLGISPTGYLEFSQSMFLLSIAWTVLKKK